MTSAEKIVMEVKYLNLVQAATHGNLKQVKENLYNGALPDDSKNGHLNTALHEAAGNNFIEIVEVLLQHKANVELRNRYDKTALDIAKMHGHNDCVMMLKKRLKSLRAKEFDFTNAHDYAVVMDAAHNGDSESVEVLHEVKADLGVCDQKGTAMHRAVRGHQPKILTLLHELGLKNVNAVDKDGETAIMVASHMGDMESVKTLCEIKADLNVCTQAGTAMHRAALAGQATILKYLYKLGAKNVNAVNPDGDTALMVASYMGDIESVDVLHEMKADLNVRTKAGTAIYRAALAGQTKMLKILHQLGAGNLDALCEDDETAVMAASYNGDIESVTVLHAMKADLNVRTKAGTAFHRAVDGGFPEMLQTLYELGATNVDAVDSDCDTACMVASYKGDVECLRVLHAIKADLDVCGSFGTALHRAVDAGHTEMIKILHDLGAKNVDAVDEDGQTVLIAASQNGDIDSVMALHDIKADLNLCGAGGTAMHHAAFSGQTDTLMILHQLGANNLDAQDEDGHTALMVAASAGNVESVKVLVAIKADINVCTKAGTVMHVAVEGGHSKMLKTLHALGANNLDVIDANDETAVMRATYKGDVESVKALHKMKADLKICTKVGTALHRAVDGHHVDMIKYLHKLGADNLDAVDKKGRTAMMVASDAGLASEFEDAKALLKSYETARQVQKVMMEGKKQIRLSRSLDKMRRAVKHARLINRLRKNREALSSSRGSQSSSRGSQSSSRGSLFSSRGSLLSSRGSMSSSSGSLTSRRSRESPRYIQSSPGSLSTYRRSSRDSFTLGASSRSTPTLAFGASSSGSMAYRPSSSD